MLHKAEFVVRKWLMHAIASKTLYGRALCPFAASVVHGNGLRVTVCPAADESTLLETVKRELNLLYPESSPSTSHPAPETTLIAVPNLFDNDYRAMIHSSWKIMDIISTTRRFEGKLQVVNFHPKAVHSLFSQGVANPSDYTIRSPCPVFHLLREEDILKAVQGSYPSPHEIPSRNARYMGELGLRECERRYHSLFDNNISSKDMISEP